MTLSPSAVYLREYNRLYTGANQEYGYDTPHLGFTTDTVEIEFRVDKSTFFHYPKNAPAINLSASNLMDSGAFAGSMPFKSDRIFKRQADYDKHTPWGNALPESLQKGIFLCAWLSGNDDNYNQKPVWMDRWFNPGELDSTYALFVSSIPAVYDTPSIFSFDPGSWYRYDHMGDNTNLTIVNSICGLQIHIDDWKERSLDKTKNKNDAYLQNYENADIQIEGVNPAERENDKALSLRGDRQHGYILNDLSFIVDDKFSCNVWMKADNWELQPTHHFISNGFRGGWSLGYNNGFFNPTHTLIDSSGNTIFVNSNGEIYKDVLLPGQTNPVKLLTDNELFTWVLDNGSFENYSHLYKIDFNGNINIDIRFNESINLYDIALDALGNVWVTNDQFYASGFNPQGDFIGATSVNDKKIVINSSNTFKAFDTIDSTVLNDDTTYWHIRNDGFIYKNDTLFLDGISATNIQATKDNDICVLFNQTGVMIINEGVDQLTNTKTYSVGPSAYITDATTSDITGRNLYMTNEIVSNTQKDYIWVAQPSTGYLYKFDQQLKQLRRINLTFVANNITTDVIKGDSSGYQWQRLFNYENIKNTGPLIEASVYLNTSDPKTTKKRVTASTPAADISKNDWHMFTISFDESSNELKLYIDTVLRATQTVLPSSSIYYKYETPLFIGTNVGRIATLDSELNNINELYHKGALDDLRFYTEPLNISDIKHIYLTKFKFKDLIWNMPTVLQSYIEEIVRFFKFKMPGQKSQFYNIKLIGLQITDSDTRLLIEDIIKDNVKKIVPAYASLYKIKWE